MACFTAFFAIFAVTVWFAAFTTTVATRAVATMSFTITMFLFTVIHETLLCLKILLTYTRIVRLPYFVRLYPYP